MKDNIEYYILKPFYFYQTNIKNNKMIYIFIYSIDTVLQFQWYFKSTYKIETMMD